MMSLRTEFELTYMEALGERHVLCSTSSQRCMHTDTVPDAIGSTPHGSCMWRSSLVKSQGEFSRVNTLEDCGVDGFCQRVSRVQGRLQLHLHIYALPACAQDGASAHWHGHPRFNPPLMELP